MKKTLKKKLTNKIRKIKEQAEYDIAWECYPHCRKCLYAVLIHYSVDEFEWFTGGCLKNKTGLNKIFCIEHVKQLAERPNKSLHNYAMSYVEQEKMKEVEE